MFQGYRKIHCGLSPTIPQYCFQVTLVFKNDNKQWNVAPKLQTRRSTEEANVPLDVSQVVCHEVRSSNESVLSQPSRMRKHSENLTMRKGQVASIASVPEHVEFESNQKDYERLDEIQALNTALCYLCSINADVAQVEAFLHAFPEALLLEGTNRLSEESARSIVESQLCSCSSSSACSRNRQMILDYCLSQDFLSYRRQKQDEDPSDQYSPSRRFIFYWGEFREDLLLVEQDIRRWRREEWYVREKLLELTLSKYEQQDMEDGHRQRPSRLRRLFCSLVVRHNSVAEDSHHGRNRLEEAEARNPSAYLFHERHCHILSEIKQGRETQFRLLKQMFRDIEHHSCAQKLFPLG